MNDKTKGFDFWEEASCGEDLYLDESSKSGFEAQANERYRLEPYIIPFADFDSAKNKKVLEIGVGLGSDHQKFAEVTDDLYGIDLTERAIKNTINRFNIFNLKSNLSIGDAEALNFDDNFFDIVYSWGVLHHSPDTTTAINEVYRVLKRGGTAKIMIYNKWSLIGIMLWTRYALFALKPWTTLESIYSSYLESPGTKAYTKKEAKKLFSNFKHVNISSLLTHGDLLESDAGQRHQGFFLNMARKIWPRKLFKKIIPNFGLFMLIEARK